MPMKQVLPYANSMAPKQEQVSRMFDSISPKYDLLNRVLSFGIDRGWRRKVVRMLAAERPSAVLDVATGTADLAIEGAQNGIPHITGIDISEGMLKYGKEKVLGKNLGDKIRLLRGDAQSLSFPDNSFDAATAAFGVRNFENLEKGLSEIYRVLRPGGIFIVLEFSQPQLFPFRQLYHFYAHYVLPVVGRAVSRDAAAYAYLPESVSAFPFGNEFLEILGRSGFKNTTWKPLTFGIASIYTGRK